MNATELPELTTRQTEILAYIKSRDICPSVRQIGREFGIGSPNGVMCHIRALRQKGYLRENDGHYARHLDVVGQKSRAELEAEIERLTEENAKLRSELCDLGR